jgi:pyridoxine kinase
VILSIQSSLTRGYVGNSAAVFTLQRLGCEVCPLNTVTLSNHPGYGRLRGRTATAVELQELIEGLDEQQWLEDCRAVLSGYLGAAANGEVVLDAVARVKASNPKALFCCDPVMGDRVEGLYVDQEIVAFFLTQAPKWADILTPNQFELEVYAGRPLRTMVDLSSAARSLISETQMLVIVTSVLVDDLPPNSISTVALSSESGWRVTTPLVPEFHAKGTGDVLTAMFLAHYLAGHPIPVALSNSVSSLFSIIESTASKGAKELSLLAAQNVIANPPHNFVAEIVDMDHID